MRIREQIERELARAEAAGGLVFLDPGALAAASPDSGPAPGAGPGADPHWRPEPDLATGALVQDPDFTLPTRAGPVTWCLRHDSMSAGENGPWGFGRRGSFPLKLSTNGSVVSVTHEDGSV